MKLISDDKVVSLLDGHEQLISKLAVPDVSSRN